jgi:branched-chain amino acid transport system substrate-binding protein
MISFQPDGLNILGHARLNPTLGDVRWFGSKDALSPVFFPPDAPAEVAQFMADVGMQGFFPTPPDNPLRQLFERNYEERYGNAPSPWALYMYDAAWISALTVMASGEYTGDNALAALPAIAAHYIGASGHKLLTEEGDSAIGVYDMMIARDVDGVLKPVTIGVWDSGSEVITRFE